MAIQNTISLTEKASGTRKILQLNNHGSLGVSLPKEWIKKHRLAPKDKVAVKETPEGYLQLVPLTSFEIVATIQKRK